jgi:hypothetical protein
MPFGPWQTMPNWKSITLRMIDDFNRHLAKSAPSSARRQLDEFRWGAARAKNRRGLRRIEKRLDAVMESQPYFRAAGKRCTRDYCQRAILACRECLEVIERTKAEWSGP